MLSRLVEQTPALLAMASDSTLSKAATTTIKNCVYNFEEHHLAERLIMILDPFQKVTTIVSAEQGPTMHKIMPILVKIEMCMQVDNQDPPVIQKVKQIIQTEMASRTKDKELALMACVLNPFTKGLEFLSPSEKELANKLLLENAQNVSLGEFIVKKEPEGDSQSTVTQQNEPPLPVFTDSDQSDAIPIEQSNDVNEPSEPTPPKKARPADMDDWLQDIMCTGESVKSGQHVVANEVSRYLHSTPMDQELTLLLWWKKNQQFFPHLSLLSENILPYQPHQYPQKGYLAWQEIL